MLSIRSFVYAIPATFTAFPIRVCSFSIVYLDTIQYTTRGTHKILITICCNRICGLFLFSQKGISQRKKKVTKCKDTNDFLWSRPATWVERGKVVAGPESSHCKALKCWIHFHFGVRTWPQTPKRGIGVKPHWLTMWVAFGPRAYLSFSFLRYEICRKLTRKDCWL